MPVSLREVDKIEILTLQDNYIDIAALDNSEMVQRAMPVKDAEVKNSILAEHGFSALVSVTVGGRSHTLLFDFGFSEHGAAFNTDALGLDLSGVEALALSHGHMDHFGGMSRMLERIGRRGLPLYVHPAAFRSPRYLKISEELKLGFPKLERESLEEAGVEVIETTSPSLMMNDTVLFLGEIPRKTEFEKGFPRAFYEKDGELLWDPIEEDTAVVANLNGKGLVVLSGCAHSGIINTVAHARQTTGQEQIHAVMGGFHLTGADFEPIIEPTSRELKKLNPAYIIPTHCTGRKAVMHLEREMPEKFLLNMSGTKMTFAA
jgi:7,8-dihydropterin-6-yl-methyl-4-(beta-D-ribofuranosyl)aminobenzene 5'-phosphate synthase